jgi:hypothetical protein
MEDKSTRIGRGWEVPEGWERENVIAGKFGVGVGELSEYRKAYLRAGYHWERYGGVTIWLSPEGVEMARGYFEPGSEEEVWAKKVREREKEVGEWAGPPGKGVVMGGSVCRVLRGCRNPRMIRVMEEGGGVNRIRVRSAINFREGMLVDLMSCRRVWGEEEEWESRGKGRVSGGMKERGREQLWELMIPLPRYAGRWGYEGGSGYIGRAGSYFKRGTGVARVANDGSRNAIMWRR